MLLPNKPQLHTNKCHHRYNGTARMPLSSWVRKPHLRDVDDGSDCELVYEIVLFYDHNRACTIYRSWDDFDRLRRNLPAWKNAARFRGEADVKGMHSFLREALCKRSGEVAIEYFLRRRMHDCGGR